MATRRRIRRPWIIASCGEEEEEDDEDYEEEEKRERERRSRMMLWNTCTLEID